MNAAEMVRRQCLARTPLTDIFSILSGYSSVDQQRPRLERRGHCVCSRSQPAASGSRRISANVAAYDASCFSHVPDVETLKSLSTNPKTAAPGSCKPELPIRI